MKKVYFIIDVEKCMDCNNCFIACKDEHVDNAWPGYTMAQPRHGHRWMDIHGVERGSYPLIDVAYRPTPCMHCENPACMAQGNGAVVVRQDGIVLFDQEKAQGREDLVSACPYGAIYWNEELNMPQKCTLCAHLLDSGWTQPRCVQACFSGALHMGWATPQEIDVMVQKMKLRPLHPELKTAPRVYYKNLYLHDRVFITGSVSSSDHGLIDCAKNVKVELFQGKKLLGSIRTDVFGDFRFDGLEKDSGEYLVLVGDTPADIWPVSVSLGNSINLGEIRL